MLSGYKLQYLRRLKGLTQKHIAESIGVTTRWIGMVENENCGVDKDTYDKWIDALYGKIKPPKVSTKKKTK